MSYLVFETNRRTKSVDILHLGGEGGGFKEGFEERTNRENMSPRASSCHCDIPFSGQLFFHDIRKVKCYLLWGFGKKFQGKKGE